jgi:hypothetical protein
MAPDIRTTADLRPKFTWRQLFVAGGFLVTWTAAGVAAWAAQSQRIDIVERDNADLKRQQDRMEASIREIHAMQLEFRDMKADIRWLRQTLERNKP